MRGAHRRAGRGVAERTLGPLTDRRRRRARLVGGGVLAGALGLVVPLACGDDEPSVGDVGVGATLPDVTLPALSEGGAPLALAELDGPAVVNLWATWCTPCREELPAFQRASVEHPDVRFVGVDIGEASDDALAFLDEIGVDTAVFEQYADPRAELTDALGVAALPVTIILDDDARIADVHLGPLTVTDLTDAIADL